MQAGEKLPQWFVSQWFNTPAPLAPADLRGRVVLLHTFQMLCPGCVAHGIPQAARVHEALPDVAVIGLHTVFEHHEAMQPSALEVFLHEYRISHPVGVDMPDTEGPIPRTMAMLQLKGTPSMVLLDRAGRIRLSHFGQVGDLELGAVLGQLLAETGQG